MTAESDFASDEVPDVRDDSGYAITASDLAFLDVAASDLHDMLGRIRPLGMSRSDYEWMTEELRYALDRDGVGDADVRLQGSSANFWSGRHKRMPYERAEVFELLSTRDEDFAKSEQMDQCLDLILNQWPNSDSRPIRRPFDVMFRSGLEFDPSDYDVQISSDEMIERIRAEVARRGVDLESVRVKNPTYDFIEKRYCLTPFRYVSAWSERAAQRLRRPVSWALFSSSGPPQATHGGPSSHFRTTDWVIPARLGG